MSKTKTPDLDTVAARLGIPVDEVTGCAESPAGLVITTADGQTYLDVPADQPDGAGQTGIMFASAPSESYGGDFPVYVSPVLADDDDVPPPPADDPPPPPATEAKVDDAERAELLREAEALGVSVTKQMKNETIAKKIADAKAK